MAARTIKVLGVDNGAGKGQLHATTRDRMSAVQKRRSHFEQLRKLGARIVGVVMRGAAVPTVTYGSKLMDCHHQC